MNAGYPPIIVMPQDCDTTARDVTAALKSSGYSVLRSFDLLSAFKSSGGSSCDPATCSCQMIVLLVYAQEGPPATLIFDGNPSQTWVYFVKDSAHAKNLGWVGQLGHLFPNNSAFSNQNTADVE